MRIGSWTKHTGRELYDPEEDEGVETTRDRLEVKLKNREWELQDNRRQREHVIENYGLRSKAKKEDIQPDVLLHYIRGEIISSCTRRTAPCKPSPQRGTYAEC